MHFLYILKAKTRKRCHLSRLEMWYPDSWMSGYMGIQAFLARQESGY